MILSEGELKTLFGGMDGQRGLRLVKKGDWPWRGGLPWMGRLCQLGHKKRDNFSVKFQ
jgi:hypothetical protein